MNDIAVVIPTRGLVYARTIESLKQNGLDGFLIIDGLGIPDAHNEGARRALESYPGYVLFVEDDMVMPAGALEQMIKKDEAIVAVDYPMDNGYSTICRQGNEILWCGLGCTLIKAGVLRNLPQPIFDTSYSWRIEEEPFSLERIENPYKYGGQDINFCLKAREYGYKIACLEGMEAQHLRTTVERKESNQGSYQVTALPPISKRQEYV